MRPCLDWTEGRAHIAGWLGAAICERLESRGGIRHNSVNRALLLTARGHTLLREYFGDAHLLPAKPLEDRAASGVARSWSSCESVRVNA